MRQIAGDFRGFSADGRLAVVQDAGKVLGLVETETGRTLARLEAPTSIDVGMGGVQPRWLAPGCHDATNLLACTSGT